MLIIDAMTKNVVCVSPDTDLLKCKKLFKEHGITHLPVVDTEKIVVGLLTQSAINSFAPQRSTPLEILEMYDMLEEAKAKQIMTVAPPTISYKGTVDQAALNMISNNITCLPVVDADDKLVGFISEWDIFKALVDVSGAAHPGVDMTFVLENKRGTLREILDLLKEEGARIVSILSSYSEDKKMRQVKIRFHSEDDGTIEAKVLEQLKPHPGLRYWGYKGEVQLCDGPKLND